MSTIKELELENVKKFKERMESALPLSLSTIFYVDEEINEVAMREIRRTHEEFGREIPRPIRADKLAEVVGHIDPELQKVLKAIVSRNSDHRAKSESLMAPIVENTLEMMKTFIDDFLKDPNVDRDMFIKHVDCEKRRFFYARIPGSRRYQAECREMIEKKMDELKGLYDERRNGNGGEQEEAPPNSTTATSSSVPQGLEEQVQPEASQVAPDPTNANSAQSLQNYDDDGSMDPNAPGNADADQVEIENDPPRIRNNVLLERLPPPINMGEISGTGLAASGIGIIAQSAGNSGSRKRGRRSTRPKHILQYGEPPNCYFECTVCTKVKGVRCTYRSLSNNTYHKNCAKEMEKRNSYAGPSYILNANHDENSSPGYGKPRLTLRFSKPVHQ